MGYQVLARKWRPKNFSELVGQTHVVNAISNALDNNRLHHAYLFTGTRGVGKTTIARIFAKSLNCEQGQGANPCNKCGTCLDINEGRYVDLLEIDAASRTKVEDTRELLDNVQYKPSRGEFKVYLIDEVHMLSKHSFNALLKTLEEPPPHVKFLLATTDPQKLPITILSRCLQFNLKALSREQISEQLSYVLGQEQISFETGAVQHLARAANGSMRDALSLTDQAIAQGNGEVSSSQVVEMLGLIDRNQVLKLLKAICERDTKATLDCLDVICTDAPDYAQVLNQLMATVHQVCLTQMLPEICKLESTSAKAIYVLSKSISQEHAQVLYQIALNGKRDLPHAPDAFSGLQMTVMRMLAFSPAQTVDFDPNTLISASAPQSQSATQSQHPQKSTSTEHAHSPVQARAVESSELVEPSPVKNEPHKSSVVPHDQLDSHDSAQSNENDFSSPLTDDTTPAQNSPSGDSAESGPESDSVQHHAPEQLSQEPMLHDSQPQEPYAQPTPEQENERVPVAVHPVDESLNVEPSIPENDDVKAHQEAVAYKEQSSNMVQQNDGPGLEDTMAKMALFDELLDLDSKDEDTGENAPVKKPELEVEAPAAAAAPSFENLGGPSELRPYFDDGSKLIKAAQVDDWAKFVDDLGVRALARQLLLHSELVEFGDALTVKISEQHSHLNEEANQITIEEALERRYHKKMALIVEIENVDKTPFTIQTNIDDMRMNYAKHTVSTNESIQELIKAFDANVIDGSIEPR